MARKPRVEFEGALYHVIGVITDEPGRSLVSGFHIALLRVDGIEEPEWLENQGSNIPAPFTT